jgi:hypothetical protein
LNAGSVETILSLILACTDDYIGLLTGARASSESHTCVFASYALTRSSRIWGFYQPNTNWLGDFPRRTISKIRNKNLKVGERNRQQMNREGFSTFLRGLTQARGIPEMGTNHTIQWTLDVMSMSRRILGTTSAAFGGH